jgi:8-oxo-dGTP diphosphatase
MNKNKRRFVYEHPHPAVTVDCVVFGLADHGLQLLLIKRADEPFKNSWALPGGFVEIDESADDAALRELEEETGVTNVFVEQLYTFSDVARDPRERVISVAYYALVRPASVELVAGSDASEAEWFPVAKLPELAFDHKLIAKTGLERLRGKVRYQPIGFELLPRKFTLKQLQQMYETVLGRALDKRNFRSKILAMGVLDPLEEVAKSEGVTGRAPKLFRFNRREYTRLVKAGFNFEI